MERLAQVRIKRIVQFGAAIRLPRAESPDGDHESEQESTEHEPDKDDHGKEQSMGWWR